MSSSLKYLLPLIVLLIVVFSATLISFTVGDQSQQNSGTDDSTAGITGPALRFTSTRIAYDPASEDLTSQTFPGFFEISDRPLPISFWFQNPHPVPIRMAVLGRSCTSCTHARVGAFPDAEVSAFQYRVATEGLVGGPLGSSGLLAALSAAALVQSAKWHDFNFDQPEESVGEVPPAPTEGATTWGLFQMGVRVSAEGAQNRTVNISMRPGTGPEEKLTFGVTLFGVAPFAVSPQAIALGNLPEGTPSRTTTLYYWSATRDRESLAPPTLTFNATDPFLTVGKPELVPAEEVPSIAGNLIGDAKGVRILSVYRFPVIVHRHQTGAAEPDIGPFQRTLGIACPGTTHAVSLPITANITGLVNLFEGGKIDLGSFDYRFGVEKIVQLISTKPDITLSIAAKEHTPSFLAADLSEPREEGGRRRWTLKVGIPANMVLGDLPQESYVVMTAKTSTGVQRVRIPVVGRGTGR